MSEKPVSRVCPSWQACFFFLITIFLQPSAWASFHAQSTNSSLSGIVKDPSGAVVPEARLTLTSGATGAERESTFSGSDGILSILSPTQSGAYSVKVVATGFSVFLQRGLVLALNESATLDVTLSVGAATQTVEVNAASSIDHGGTSHTRKKSVRTFSGTFL